MKTLKIGLTLLLLAFLNVNLFAQWQIIQTGLYYLSDVKTINQNEVITCGENGIFKSSNRGNSWIQVENSAHSNPKISFYGNYGLAIAGETAGFVERTTDGGNSWFTVYLNYFAPSFGNSVQMISPNTAYRFCTINGGFNSTTYEILKTINGGMNWDVVYYTYNNPIISNVFFVDENTAYANIGNQLKKTTDGCLTWNTLSSGVFYDIRTTGNNILYAKQNWWGNLVRSTDGGTTWGNLLNDSVASYDILNSNFIIATGFRGQIYRTTNGGTTWINDVSNVDVYLSSVAIFDDNNAVAVGNHGTILKYTNLTGIHSTSSETPEGFKLSQNYPNPFNPSTKISFSIPKASFVKMVVFDVTGREVETLVNENLNAGTFEVDFNASKLTSGVYFYKLVTDNFTETKKMILTK